MDCDYNGGLTFPQTSTAIDATHAFAIGNNAIGDLATARDTFEGDGTGGNHNIYYSSPRTKA